MPFVIATIKKAAAYFHSIPIFLLMRISWQPKQAKSQWNISYLHQAWLRLASSLNKANVNVDFIVRQSYDGASIMHRKYFECGWKLELLFIIPWCRLITELTELWLVATADRGDLNCRVVCLFTVVLLTLDTIHWSRSDTSTRLITAAYITWNMLRFLTGWKLFNMKQFLHEEVLLRPWQPVIWYSELFPAHWTSHAVSRLFVHAVVQQTLETERVDTYTAELEGRRTTYNI